MNIEDSALHFWSSSGDMQRHLYHVFKRTDVDKITQVASVLLSGDGIRVEIVMSEICEAFTAEIQGRCKT